jgi:hypothetical protein
MHSEEADEHPSLPVELRDHPRRDGQFRLRLVLALFNRLFGQDHALLLTEGGKGMDDTGLGVEPESPAGYPLGVVAVEGHPLFSTLPVLRPIERGPQGGREGARIQLAEEPVKGRLTGGGAVREAEGTEEIAGLARSPLGNRQDRGMGTR